MIGSPANCWKRKEGSCFTGETARVKLELYKQYPLSHVNWTKKKNSKLIFPTLIVIEMYHCQVSGGVSVSALMMS